MSYKIIKGIIRFFMFFVFRIKVEWKGNIPKTGGAIVAINHRSNWDVIVSGISSPRPFGFMAKAELFENKLLGRLISSLGAFPVHRGKGDFGAIKAAVRRLEAGEIVTMFPEGKRVKNGETVQAKQGAVVLAMMAKVPIIPIKLSGKYRWMSKITVTVGRPISYEEYYGKKLSPEQRQELSDKLMATIRDLDKHIQVLPEGKG